jgi:hypothetical protein
MVEKIRLNRYLVAHLNKNLTRLHPDTFASCEPLKIVTDNHNPNRAALFVTTVDFGKNQVLPQSLVRFYAKVLQDAVKRTVIVENSGDPVRERARSQSGAARRQRHGDEPDGAGKIPA